MLKHLLLKHLAKFSVVAILTIISVWTWRSYVKILNECTISAQKSDAPDLEMHPTVSITTLKLHEKSEKNNLTFILNAQTSDFNHATNTITCYGVLCVFEQKKAHIGQFTAQKAEYNKPSKQGRIDGSVHGTFKDLKIEAQDLCYSHKDQILSTKKPATYTHPHFFCTAGESTINLAHNSIQLTNGVYTEFSRCSTTDKSSQ